MNAILYANGTSENHGCEAISLASADILTGLFGTLYCTTTNMKYEKELNTITALKNCKMVEYYYFRKKSFINIQISRAERLLLKTNSFFTSRAWTANVERVFKDCKIALSVGGDNYCNPNPEWLFKLHAAAKREGLITVLWGASVEESCLEYPEMKADLASFDLICARESLSFATLSKINGNVMLYPDPAFMLETKFKPLPTGFSEGNTIGINISAAIMGFERNKGLALKSYQGLVRHIIENTSYQIALIPHVVFGGVLADYETQKILYDEFKSTGRVVMIGDCSCTELKGYIARCKMLVAARTHASIAAYSSCVPTLVVGYSVKAKGIAIDLFGTDDGYVLSVQSLKDENQLAVAFQRMDKSFAEIKARLEAIMPEYKRRTYSARTKIEGLIKNIQG